MSTTIGSERPLALVLAPRSPGRSAARRWARLKRVRRRGQLLLGVAVTGAFILIGVVGPLLAPFGVDEQNLGNALAPPLWAGGSWTHPLGTDPFGRDILTRLIYGARVSLVVGTCSVAVAGLIGTLVGLISGYVGGNVDALCMRIADIQYSFPYILVAIVIAAFWQAGLLTVVLALSLSSWMTFARMVRASVLSEKERDYVMATRAIGAGDKRIIFLHLLPNITAMLLVFATFQVPTRLLAEATLSFLGLGVQPPTPSWGNMLAQSRSYLIAEPWLVALPGLVLMLVSLGVNQLGDGLRDYLDPRLRRSE